MRRPPAVLRALVPVALLAAAGAAQSTPPRAATIEPGPDDGAPEYREAIRLVRAALEVADDDVVPWTDGEGVVDDELRATLERTRDGLAVFRTATTRGSCRFARVGDNPPFGEFEDVQVDLLAIAKLVALDGRRALEDGEPAHAVESLRAVLAWTRHVYAQPGFVSVPWAHAGEEAALALAAPIAARGRDDDAAGEARGILAAHAKRRPGLAVFEAKVRLEVLRIVDAFLGAAKQDGDDRLADLLRPLAVEVRNAADGLLTAALAPLATAEPDEVAAALAQVTAIARGWKADVPKDRTAIAAMDAAERARTLAKLLILMAFPDVERSGNRHLELDAELVRAAR